MAESRATMLKRLKAQRRKAGIGEFRKSKRKSSRKSSSSHKKRGSKRKSTPSRRSKRRGGNVGGKKMFGIKIPGIVLKGATGIGLAAIFGLVAMRFAPNRVREIKIAGSFLGGGLEGLVANQIVSGGAGQAAPAQEGISEELV